MLKDAGHQWSLERAARMAAALAFYTTFSLAPLLVILVGILGLVFDADEVQARMVDEFELLIGPQGAAALADVLTATQTPGKEAGSWWATAVGFVLLVFGSSGVFAELQDSLNTIWDVKPRSAGGLLAVARRRFSAFVMVLGSGFLLMVSLVLSAALTAVSDMVGSRLPMAAPLLHGMDFVLSFLMVALLFAMIYRLVPDARIGWRDVWIGATVGALLFSVGKLLLGIYLGRTALTSSYGAAGSLVVVLVWVYYTAQVLFFGAELTQVYATSRHSVEASPHAYKAPTRAKLAAAVARRH